MKVFSSKAKSCLPDSTYLTSVPRSGEKAASVLLVVLGHLQPVHPFDVEADLVL